MRHAWFVIVALATSANAAPKTAPVAALKLDDRDALYQTLVN